MDRLGVCAWLILGRGGWSRNKHSYDGFGQESFWFSICSPRILIPFLSFAGAFRIIP